MEVTSDVSGTEEELIEKSHNTGLELSELCIDEKKSNNGIVMRVLCENTSQGIQVKDGSVLDTFPPTFKESETKEEIVDRPCVQYPHPIASSSFQQTNKDAKDEDCKPYSSELTTSEDSIVMPGLCENTSQVIQVIDGSVLDTFPPTFKESETKEEIIDRPCVQYPHPIASSSFQQTNEDAKDEDCKPSTSSSELKTSEVFISSPESFSESLSKINLEIVSSPSCQEMNDNKNVEEKSPLPDGFEAETHDLGLFEGPIGYEEDSEDPQFRSVIYGCSSCFTIVGCTKDSIIRHQREHHLDPLQCKVCQSKFVTTEGYEYHKSSHIRYPCLHCPKEFNRLIDVEIHQQQHFLNKLVRCCKCGKEFYLNAALKLHQSVLEEECLELHNYDEMIHGRLEPSSAKKLVKCRSGCNNMIPRKMLRKHAADHLAKEQKLYAESRKVAKKIKLCRN